MPSSGGPGLEMNSYHVKLFPNWLSRPAEKGDLLLRPRQGVIRVKVSKTRRPADQRPHLAIVPSRITQRISSTDAEAKGERGQQSPRGPGELVGVPVGSSSDRSDAPTSIGLLHHHAFPNYVGVNNMAVIVSHCGK